MTTITYRGVQYDREQHHELFKGWWALVHRATLWLCYRGIKYRPATQNHGGPSVFWPTYPLRQQKRAFFRDLNVSTVFTGLLGARCVSIWVSKRHITWKTTPLLRSSRVISPFSPFCGSPGSSWTLEPRSLFEDLCSHSPFSSAVWPFPMDLL